MPDYSDIHDFVVDPDDDQLGLFEDAEIVRETLDYIRELEAAEPENVYDPIVVDMKVHFGDGSVVQVSAEGPSNERILLALQKIGSLDYLFELKQSMEGANEE